MLNRFSHVRLFATLWTVACQAPPSMDTKVGCHALLPGIFPTQGSNPPLTSPALAGRFFTSSTIWEARTSEERIKKRMRDEEK